MPQHDPPLISVALSVYNGAAFLPAQLDSILGQRGVELEVVAVDDRSSDGSLALLEACARRDPRVRLHANPHNLGPTRSFERAMSLCRGEFIAPSDQDDIWLPDKLRILLEAIGNRDLAYCDSEYCDAEGTPSGRRVSDSRRMQSGGRPLAFLFENSVSGHAMLLRRNLLDCALPFPPDLYYDWTLAMLAAARAGIAYVPRPLVLFRRHGQAFSALGRDAPRPARSPDRYRRWLADRAGLLHVLIRSGLDADGRAARLATALAQASAGGGRWPLLREVWRERRELAGRSWPDAVRLQWRLLHKLNRARAETPPPA